MARGCAVSFLRHALCVNTSWIAPCVRATIAGVVAVSVSLPGLFWMHSHFGLGAPPISGVVTLGASVVASCIGAALLGWGIGQLMGRRASGTLAALAGFVWGITLCFSAASFYGGLLADEISRDAAETALANRDKIADSALETLDQARSGHASKAAEVAGTQFSDGAGEVALRGGAKLPAMSLLVWTLLCPPLLAAWECRRARR